MSAAPIVITPKPLSANQLRLQAKREAAAERTLDMRRKAARVMLSVYDDGLMYDEAASMHGYSSGRVAQAAVQRYYAEQIATFWPEVNLKSRAASRPKGTSKAQERYDRVITLRGEGYAWKDIARMTGYANAHSAQRCHRDDRRRVAGGQKLRDLGSQSPRSATVPPSNVRTSA